MKYIIVDSAMCGEYPILFPDHINHCDMARKFDGKIVSAGKIEFYCKEKDIWVGGNSVSLNLTCRPDDITLVKRCVTLGG